MVGVDVVELDDGSVADLIVATRRRAVQAEAELLVLAGVWGHRAEVDPDLPGRDGDKSAAPGAARQPGGDGTPAVDMDAVIEFGTLTHTTSTGAASMIADALDLEHRLPALWRRVCRGEVAAWKARTIARRVRHLSAGAAGFVDRAVVDYVESLPWGRLLNLVEAKTIEADPLGAEARVTAAEAERFVRTGRTTEHGLKTIVAKVDAGDAIWFVAMVDRIATVLAEEGDTEPVDVRRAKAIGVLAAPGLAAQLIATHGRPAIAPSHHGKPSHHDKPAPGGGAVHAPDLGRGSTVDSSSLPRVDRCVGKPDGQWEEAAAPPPSEDAWPPIDPWERRRWIPDPLWQAVHRRHRDDPGPEVTGHGDGHVPPDPASTPVPETGKGRAADPALAQTVMNGLTAETARLAPTAVVHLHLYAEAVVPPAATPARFRPETGPCQQATFETVATTTTPSERMPSETTAPETTAPESIASETTAAWSTHEDLAGWVNRVGRVGRMEGVGTVTVGQVRRFLGSERVRVVVKPVIDLNDRPPAVDAWEIPVRIRERTRLRMPAEIFPWAASTGTNPDLDHTIPYRPPGCGGPRGQTCETGLGPLARTQHNAKTRGRWRCRQPMPGVFVWRSPHGQIVVVDPDGSHDYGRGAFARQLWEAAVRCSTVSKEQADAEWISLGVPLLEIDQLRRAA